MIDLRLHADQLGLQGRELTLQVVGARFCNVGLFDLIHDYLSSSCLARMTRCISDHALNPPRMDRMTTQATMSDRTNDDPDMLYFPLLYPRYMIGFSGGIGSGAGLNLL